MLSNFYHSKEWRQFTEMIKASRDNVCAFCGGHIVEKYDCICHHVIELTDRNVNDASIAFNPDNIQLVHHKCHNKIHNKLGVKQRQVFLVWGSPLSGKSTWVDSVKNTGDLIVDIDNIWQSISGCDRYIKPPQLAEIVFSIRDMLIDSVAMRRGNWNNAYVIGGYPFISQRERLINRLGAREVFIDTPKDVCMLRACERPAVWGEYVEKWWEDYTPPVSSQNF